MQKKLSLLLFFTCIIFLITFTGCGSRGTKKVVIGVMPDVNSVPFIVADQKGLYKEQGADVEVQMYMSAVERDAAMQAGKIDGEMSDILSAVFSMQEGFQVRMTSVTEGDYVLLAGKDSGIRQIQDFSDKEIGVSTNTIIEYAADSMLMKNGLPSEKIKKTSIPKIPVRLEMLQNGKLNGACIPEPLSDLAEAEGARVIARSSEQGLAPSVMVFSKASIDQKKDEIRKVYKAYNAAVQQINNNPESFKDLVIEKAKFPEELRPILKFPGYHQAVAPEERDIRNVMDWMKSKGLLKQNLEAGDMIEGNLL